MISLEESVALYGQSLQPLAPRRLALSNGLGLVLAEAVRSRVDLPLFTQSAVDGYALRSADGAGPLRVTGEIAAGSAATLELVRGCAVRIFTGGALPAGADTCARQEIVERQGDVIVLRQALKPGADTRFRGEEIRRGDALARSGLRLHSGLIAALAMAGVDNVSVRLRPRVALLVSGDEVADANRELSSGQIFDANGPLVTAWLRERGYPIVMVRRVPDDRDMLRSALIEAFAQADVVLTTGGVSVGDRDYIPEVAQALGVRQVFWKVAQKPGKPLWFGVNQSGKALLGFPGNPAAVLIGLHVHARHLLSVLEGELPVAPAWQHGLLAREVRADAQRDQLLRVGVSSRSDGAIVLTPLPRQESHMLSNLASAAGLAWIRRRETSLLDGASVRWLPL